TIPRDSTGRTVIQIQFAVAAGATYLIEMSSTTTDGGNSNANLAVSMGTPAVDVSISPPNVTVVTGGPAQTFTAQVTNAANTGVRWSLSPSLGTISIAGQYTPPATVNSPTTVTVTATSFADPSRSASAKITLTSVAPLPSSIQITA